MTNQELQAQVARLNAAVAQLGEALFSVGGPDRLRRYGKASLASLIEEYRVAHPDEKPAVEEVQHKYQPVMSSTLDAEEAAAGGRSYGVIE